MCGVTGFLDPSNKWNAGNLNDIVFQMSKALLHRGPDDGGTWVDARSGVALGHRRLSIIDPSSQGHQPMHSASGRYVITYNGEIYNFKLLGRELSGLGHHFRGSSDTEILLAAITQWGMRDAVSRFDGMFAFALWDRSERVLHMVRDRLGEKPLYYGRVGKMLLFGSELKALRAHPDFKAAIDRNALALYLRHSYIPAPYSIYEGIRKLPPGMILTVPATDGPLPDPVPYWSARGVAERGVGQPVTTSASDGISRLDTLLRNAVRNRMVADVPLGAFLSGGIDSSTVVALMQVQSDRPVRTFTIGFNESGYDEAVHAREVARHLGTDHTELYVTAEEAMAVIPRLPALYDEPFSDSSQIPTFLVSQLARRYVTVSLSGDGGDELFAGYNRHFWAMGIWNNIRWIPRGLRRLVGRTLTQISPMMWDRIFTGLGPVLPSRMKQRTTGDKLHKLMEILDAPSREAIYLSLVSHWKDPASIVQGATEPPTVFTDRRRWADLGGFIEQMMYLDLIAYLPDDILVKVDRASMGVSLEARVPLLDHRVVEFAWSLPLSLKIRNGQGKWLLRQVLNQYVPEKLINRPKMGFGVPIDNWLRGPLREWAESHLNEKRLGSEGFLKSELIRAKWDEHLSGARNWQYYLWDILMFQAWLEANESA